MKRLLALHFCLAVIPWNVPQVQADDGDVSDANIQPNTIIFIDASGSMKDPNPGRPHAILAAA